MEVKGECLCGGFKYEVSGEPVISAVCHCSRCQKMSGGASAAAFMVEPAQFEVLQGADLVGAYEEEGHATRHFCTRCGSSLYGTSMGHIFVQAGSLEPGSGFTPDFNIMTDFRADWESGADGLPEFGEFPPLG
jgi:hypothetical protein